jgi:hypothetical protein
VVKERVMMMMMMMREKRKEDLFVQLDEEGKDALLENTTSVHLILEKVHSYYAYACCHRS